MFPLLALTLGMMSPIGGPRLKPETFRSWFESAGKHRLEIPAEVSARAGEFRYIFVSGFRSESLHGYFAQNIQELKSLGVPKRAIHVLTPSSHKTVDDYADTFATDLTKIADQGPERLVVIAHSRGACDMLTFALRNPEFTSDRIEVMFLIQGPFGGSGLADYVMGDGPPVEKPMRSWHRLVAKGVGGLERYLISTGKHGSLAGLTHESSHAYWEDLLEANADAIPVISPRVFYIESETEPSNLKMIFRATSSYLTLHYGPNDGVVARGDQSLPGVGTSLGVLDAGHADLTRKGTHNSKRARKALTQAIVMAVGRTDA